MKKNKYPEFGTKLNADLKRAGKFSGFALRDKTALPTLNGPQREKVAKAILNHEQYMNYRGCKLQCRVTIPVVSLSCIRMIKKELKLLVNDLTEIQQQRTKSSFQRVLEAQERITWTHFRIKGKSSVTDKFGVHGLK